MRLNNGNMGLRGHDYTLKQKSIYKPVCEKYFSNRLVKLLNKLPEHVISRYLFLRHLKTLRPEKHVE